MKMLYKNKKYTDSLFFGHLTLECVMKALVVQDTKEHAPKIHNLVRLVELTEIDISLDEKKSLGQINEFNMEARYPDVKFAFYKMCDKQFTDQYIPVITELYKKICQAIKQKK